MNRSISVINYAITIASLLFVTTFPAEAKTPEEMCKDMDRKIATIAVMDRLPASAPQSRIDYEIEKLIKYSESKTAEEKCARQMTPELHSCMMQQYTVDDVMECNYRNKGRTKTKKSNHSSRFP
ncbi:MAG: hypothetical protein AAB408_04695 [Patescibacteria group bacterium]